METILNLSCYVRETNASLLIHLLEKGSFNARTGCSINNPQLMFLKDFTQTKSSSLEITDNLEIVMSSNCACSVDITKEEGLSSMFKITMSHKNIRLQLLYQN